MTEKSNSKYQRSIGEYTSKWLFSALTMLIFKKELEAINDSKFKETLYMCGKARNSDSLYYELYRTSNKSVWILKELKYLKSENCTRITQENLNYSLNALTPSKRIVMKENGQILPKLEVSNGQKTNN